MIGMRNIIVHRYFETNLETVYETTRYHLPELVDQLRLVLGDEDRHEASADRDR
jgi:uncharacterized protein with HEPN domain